MAFPTINPATPLGSSKPRVLDDELRQLKQDTIDSFEEISGFPYIAATKTAVWTTATRPTGTSLIDKITGYNSTLGYEEYYDLATTTWIAKATGNDHIASTTAHTAANLVNVPAGTIAATTVQAALNELDTEKAKLAGDSTQTFAVADATAETMAVALGQLAATLAVNGHVEIPAIYNGSVVTLIINWGTIVATNDTNTAVTFEKAFPTACLCALASHNHSFSTSNDAGCGTLNWTKTGMNVRSGSALNGNVCWLAIGH